MKDVIGGFFNVISVLFDKIPILNKFKGYRSVVGFVGLGVLAVLKINDIGDADIIAALQIGFEGFTALSLLAKKP